MFVPVEISVESPFGLLLPAHYRRILINSQRTLCDRLFLLILTFEFTKPISEVVDTANEASLQRMSSSMAPKKGKKIMLQRKEEFN